MSVRAAATAEASVAVLVDCDNISPEVLEYALRVVAQFGRVVLRRGYGNHATLANKWQESLVRLAFTPCLQYQYDRLVVQQEAGNYWTVRLAPPHEVAAATVA
jgi:hypothetical protein